MRLVIEREGGFTIIEDADAITEIDVSSDAVVLTIEVGGDKWSKSLPVSGHEEACRVSAAIAVRCGELVEPLAEQPSNGLDDAADDDLVGVAMAGLVRKHSTPMAVAASVWVAGEPPKGGLWYVVARAGVFGCVAWDGYRFRDWFSETVLMGGEVAHLPNSLPPRR